MLNIKKHVVLGAVLIAALPTAGYAESCKPITKDEVTAAQKRWAHGIVAIGKARDHQSAALNHINTLYGYDLGLVLFKPTKAAQDQFRGTKDEALSYFVKGSVPEDQGFALAPYTKVRFENEGIIADCDSALAMGNYYFTTTQGKDIKVEYSFGYVRDKNGQIKINLHHSSLPYSF